MRNQHKYKIFENGFYFIILIFKNFPFGVKLSSVFIRFTAYLDKHNQVPQRDAALDI